MVSKVAGDLRKYGEDHINKSLKQIDPNTWLIGNLILRRSPPPSETATRNGDGGNSSYTLSVAHNPLATWNDNGDNSSYTLSVAPNPLPVATTPPNSSYIKLLYEAGDAQVVWSIGSNVFCKATYITKGVTPESVTIDWVRNKQPSLETPKVLHHAFHGDVQHLFYLGISGRNLDTAWPSLDEKWRRHYVDVAVNIIKEMAEWKGDAIGGVDGQGTEEHYLTDPQESVVEDFSSASLQAACEKYGMGCSNPVFFHTVLAPECVIVENEPNSGKVGIIDFNYGGFFPRSWIVTKIQWCSGMDIVSVTDHGTPTDRRRFEYRTTIAKALLVDGFDDFSVAYGIANGFPIPDALNPA